MCLVEYAPKIREKRGSLNLASVKRKIFLKFVIGLSYITTQLPPLLCCCYFYPLGWLFVLVFGCFCGEIDAGALTAQQNLPQNVPVGLVVFRLFLVGSAAVVQQPAITCVDAAVARVALVSMLEVFPLASFLCGRNGTLHAMCTSVKPVSVCSVGG